MEKIGYLLDWVATLSTFTKDRKTPSLEDFKDGEMLGRILRESIDPNFFRELNNAPLVKVVEMMKKYLSQHLDHNIPANLLPNAGKIISDGNADEIGRLLQLLIACAVKSPRNETFVIEMKKMEETTQISLMQALQEVLQDNSAETSLSVEANFNDSQIVAWQETIDKLSQENYELKGQLSHIVEEKVALLTENDRLSSQLTSHLNDPESIHMTIKHHEELKKEVEKLREENYKMEASVDDYKLRTQVVEKQLAEAHAKMASTASSAEDIVRLKDEMDSLREAAAKTSQYEATIKIYKKKLDEMAFLKSSLKATEEKNEELHKTNLQLEDDIKKVGGLKSQVDAVKKELAETQQRLSQETQRALKAEFDCKLLREKNETAILATSRLQEEKIRLDEQLDELRLNSDMMDRLSNIPTGSGADSIELLAPHVRQRIVRLELENKKLNEKLSASIESGSAGEGSKVLVEQLRKHEAELDEQLLTKNQELLDAQSSSEEKIKRLEGLLLEKEEEIKKRENQYRKCMDKAKSVIVSLEPTASAALDLSKSDPEKDKAQAIREREENVMATMFYNLSLQLHRTGVESRNATFLQRHRHPNPPRRKSEM